MGSGAADSALPGLSLGSLRTLVIVGFSDGRGVSQGCSGLWTLMALGENPALHLPCSGSESISSSLKRRGQ